MKDGPGHCVAEQNFLPAPCTPGSTGPAVKSEDHLTTQEATENVERPKLGLFHFQAGAGAGRRPCHPPLTAQPKGWDAGGSALGLQIRQRGVCPPLCCVATLPQSVPKPMPWRVRRRSTTTRRMELLARVHTGNIRAVSRVPAFFVG